MDIKWWEKTVEYKFVMLMDRRQDSFFLAALDGVHEKAGDVFFCSDDIRWILIEFKRDINSIKDGILVINSSKSTISCGHVQVSC